MSSWAKTERADLAATLHELGSQAPTLCGNWRALELVSHLVLRASRLDGLIGIVLPVAAGYTQRLQRQLEQRYGFDGLVQRFAAGSPLWHPLAIPALDEAANVVEYFVHHEDLRRAATTWKPRELQPGHQAELWNRTRRLAKVLVRQATPLHLVAPGYGELLLPARSAVGNVAPLTTVSGLPSELVLFCYGRQAHSLADVSGDPERIAAVKAAKLGL
ncbi:MAG: TIGR03085 family protein [Acidimicrobiales bacterium]|nr:MAG: TIGR03085 family protein [Acidimicrobiales bacterium]